MNARKLAPQYEACEIAIAAINERAAARGGQYTTEELHELNSMVKSILDYEDYDPPQDFNDYFNEPAPKPKQTVDWLFVFTIALAGVFAFVILKAVSL